jgi:hypothetical protein
MVEMVQENGLALPNVIVLRNLLSLQPPPQLDTDAMEPILLVLRILMETILIFQLVLLTVPIQVVVLPVVLIQILGPVQVVPQWLATPLQQALEHAAPRVILPVQVVQLPHLLLLPVDLLIFVVVASVVSVFLEEIQLLRQIATVTAAQAAVVELVL